MPQLAPHQGSVFLHSSFLISPLSVTVSGSTVLVYVVSSIAVASLREAGGPCSLTITCIARWILWWAEGLHIDLGSLPVYHGERQSASECVVQVQSDPEVRLDTHIGALSGSQQVVASDYSSVCHLITSPKFTYFSPFHVPRGMGPGAFLHTWVILLVYAYPPWALIPQVIRLLRLSSGVLVVLFALSWPQRLLILGLMGLVVITALALPSCPGLLRLPSFPQRHLGIHRLSFLAWHLASTPP